MGDFKINVKCSCGSKNIKVEILDDGLYLYCNDCKAYDMVMDSEIREVVNSEGNN